MTTSVPGAPIGSTRPGPRDNCFDALRLFAASAVVIGHATHHLGVGFLWFQPDSRLWFRDGVALFFVMSGLLVFRSAQRCQEDGRPLIHFYVNRLLRIVPAIYAYLAVTSILLFASGTLPLSDLASTAFVGWLASGLILIPVYHPAAWQEIGSGVVNGSLWTIPVEVSFYLTVPLFAFVARRIGFARFAAALVGLAITGLALGWIFSVPHAESLPGKLLGISFLPYLVYFATGILLARVWARLPQSGWIAALCAVVYLSLRLRIPGFNESSDLLPYAATLLWVVPFGYLAVWIGYHGPASLSRLTHRIGDLSFGTYIWHMIVINAVLIYGVDRIPPSLRNPILPLGVLSLSLAIAWLSWHLVERPALRLKPFTSRPTEPILSPTTPPTATTQPRAQRGTFEHEPAH